MYVILQRFEAVQGADYSFALTDAIAKISGGYHYNLVSWEKIHYTLN